MPRVSVWLARTALIHLVLGSLLGGALLLARGGVAAPAGPTRSLHLATMLLGWICQLTFGVAWWILPRLPGPAARGRETPVWAAYALLNAAALFPLLGWESWTPVAALFAALAFAVAAWPRIRAFGAGA